MVDLGDQRVSAELRLGDALCFHQIAQHIGVRSRPDGVVFILVGGGEVAEGVEVHLLAVVEFAFSEKAIHDFLSFLEMLVGLD